MKPAWQADVAESNYDAARSYLSLLLDTRRAGHIILRLQYAPLSYRRANDVLRACGRDALAADDPGVRRVLRKIKRGKRLSPILVVSFAPEGADIADGYHRLSAIYHLDPFGRVPLRIAHEEQKR